MLANELRKKYLKFFEGKKHKVTPSASLIPENDPTVLFTTAGMHPLVPYLLGQKHPLGKRIANVQKCIRTTDIEKVGNNTHSTFLEMLGNWSLGDYWKKEAIEWSFEFLAKVLKFDVNRMHITIFKGDKDAPRDEESARIWENLGVPKKRMYYLPKEDNWWGPAGETGPCGPSTEMFIDTGKKECSSKCKPGCSCGKYFEIWNDVFMEYNKMKNGKYVPLKQKNVDTGMGVERTVAMLQGKKSVYDTELFVPIIETVRKMSRKMDEKSERIIADHLRTATFILGDEMHVVPSNLDRGYVLRRLIRRAIRHGRNLGINDNFTSDIAKVVIKVYSNEYKELGKNKEFILSELNKEENNFREKLGKGIKVFEGMARTSGKRVSGKDAFLLFQSYGFPLEMTKELADEKNIKLDEKGFFSEFKRHQKISRKATEKKFKSGLADNKKETIKMHTATHLLQSALRKVLGDKVDQRGSNITPKRLRFDFSFDRKVTKEELGKVEKIVNENIRKSIDVKRDEMSLGDAKKSGAVALFDGKYDTIVSVYTMGTISKEVCAGPHVKNTKELGKFKIIKEESVAAGVRRIKAELL